MLNANKERLVWLLKATQRPQNIQGKSTIQVNSCLLIPDDTITLKVSTCSIVKDGVSSLSKFSVPVNNIQGKTPIPVSNINNLLGALKYHGNEVTLSHKNDKLLIKSNSKQTTLSSSLNARFGDYGTSTLKEWSTKSQGVAEVIDAVKGTYKLKVGDVVKPMASWLDIDSTDLFEALRCTNMNSQKLNQYRFVHDTTGLNVLTGKELKGSTSVSLTKDNYPKSYFDLSFGGGLDMMMGMINHNVDLHIIDFTNLKQGFKLIINLHDDDFIFQSSIEVDNYV